LGLKSTGFWLRDEGLRLSAHLSSAPPPPPPPVGNSVSARTGLEAEDQGQLRAVVGPAVVRRRESEAIAQLALQRVGSAPETVGGMEGDLRLRA
jgi:hypothetical protein